MIERHAEYTAAIARATSQALTDMVPKFVKVLPKDYACARLTRRRAVGKVKNDQRGV
jgi:hypothetical protein